MESVNQAGRGLLEVGSGDSPNGLQARLEELNESWEFVRCETERKQLELENRLSQVRRQKIQFNNFLQEINTEVFLEYIIWFIACTLWRPLVFTCDDELHNS